LTREQLVNELAYIEDRCLELGISRPVSFAYPGYETHPDALQILTQRGYLFARAGEDRTYHPSQDHPLLIPSFSTTGSDQKRVLDALKQAKYGEIVVLTVHGVPDYAHPHVTTPPELFEVYLDYLRDNHYTVIALRDLAKFIDPVRARQVLTDATHSSKH
jgi:peptidoglycan-N-acetylglucosamine deacetylase